MKYFLSIFTFTIVVFGNGIAAQRFLIEEANALYAAHEYKQAEHIYNQIAQQKNNDKWLYKAGICALKQKKYETALKNFEKVENPGKLSAYFYLYYGKTLQATKKYNQALTTFTVYKEKIGSEKANLLIKQCQFSLKYSNKKSIYTVSPTNLTLQGSFLGGCFVGNTFYFSEPNKVIDPKTQGTHQQYRLKKAVYENGIFNKAQAFANSIKSPYYLGSPFIAKNGNILYYTINDAEVRYVKKKNYSKVSLSSDGFNTLNVGIGKKENGKWRPLIAPAFNSREYSCFHATISADGSKMFLSSDKEGGFGGYDIYYSLKTATGWSSLINCGSEVNSKLDEMFPLFVADSALYFASNSWPGFGGADIFYAKYNVQTKKFGQAQNLGTPVNSSYDDFGLMLKDNQNLFFASNRLSSPGQDQIYHAFLPVNYKRGLGEAVSQLTLKPIANAKIHIYIGDSLVASRNADKNGNWYYEKFDPAKRYIIIGKAEGFKPSKIREVIPTKDNLKNLSLKFETIIKKDMTFIFNDILFEYDKAVLLKSSKQVLDRLANLLVKNPNARVELSAHSDSRGGKSYNKQLSQERAESCVDYLINSGVISKQLLARGYGESQLKNNCTDGVECDEAEHAINRRVEIQVLEIMN